jgi:CheY-like chemotaxis protein
MPIRPKIIYVEDDAADAELFERNLAKSGVSAEVLILDNATCMSYLRRIALEDQELPDILIFDLKMPGEGGIGILRSVRELPEFDATPVVIFSGSMGPQEKA